MNTLRKCTVSIMLLSATGLAACERNPTTGPAETAGRSIDQAVQSAGDAVSNATEKTGEAISDTAITSKIKAAILAEADLKVLQIHVETSNGMVALTGAVDSQADSDRAASIARRVDGVKAVDNQLTVRAAG
jgi:hyperosmotically inducible protein